MPDSLGQWLTVGYPEHGGDVAHKKIIALGGRGHLEATLRSSRHSIAVEHRKANSPWRGEGIEGKHAMIAVTSE